MAELGSRRRLVSRIDWGLFCSAVVVPVLGLVVLYSAGYDPDAKRLGFVPEFVRSPAFAKQIVFLAAGIGAMAAGAAIPTTFLARYAYVILGIGVALLAAVAAAGTVVNGSRRWLSLGPVNLQPAEFVKLGVVLTTAKLLAKSPPPPGGYRTKHLVLPLLVMAVPMGLIYRQPDLGTALATGAAGGLMILFVGVNWRTLAAWVVAASLVVYKFVWPKLHGYQKNRVMVLLDDSVDPKGTGYHILQSKIAVGSGGLTGRGYLRGTQSQLEFLPEHTTDFIFSVLAEEWGFLGTLVLIVAYYVFIGMMLRVAFRAKDTFSCLVTIGITSVIFFHATVNMGMVVGIFPVVGIPLPLFSYGGSSMLSTMFGIGIVMGVSMRRQRY